MITMTVGLAFAGAGFDAPTQAVSAFVQAGDQSDVDGLQQVTHDQFRVVARMPDGVTVMDRSTYLGLIGKGVIGGQPRELRVTGVTRHGEDLATVQGVLTSDAARFDSSWTVARIEGSWLVVQDAVTFEPNAP